MNTEKAARELCLIRGLDPDELVSHGAKPDANGWAPAVLLHSPRWRLVVDEIQRHIEVDMAIRKAMQR